jgi:hypothetical protein
MGIWSWFLGKDANDAAPNIRFGRYSDSYKQPENYAAWEASLQAYERGDFLECCRQFLFYIQDKKENNVQWREKDGVIEAALIQGSQKVTMQATAEYFKAESHIAKAENLSVGLMRRLLEQNSQLNFGHFALSPDNELNAIVTTHAIDASPYKLYYAIKEIAVISDKQDNLLLEEFKNLQMVDDSLRLPMPEKEQEIKYQLVINTIQQAFDAIDQTDLNLEQHNKVIGYTLFAALFRIDYLTCPEGYVMDIIERSFRTYNQNDGKNIVQKNNQLRKEAQEILSRPKEDHLREMYRVTSTFGIAESATHERVRETIETSIVNADWYERNNYPWVAQAVYDYIVGFLFFSFAMPKSDKNALDLYYEILDETYFHQLGFSSKYKNTDNSIQKNEVEKKLQAIFAENKEKYPKAKFDTSEIDYNSSLSFSKTYLLMLLKLDLTRSN